MPGNVLGIVGDITLACVPHALVERLGDVTSLAPVHTVSVPRLGMGLKHRIDRFQSWGTATELLCLQEGCGDTRNGFFIYSSW